MFIRYCLSDPGSVGLGRTGNEVLPLRLRVLQEDVDHLVGVDDDAVVALDHMPCPLAVLIRPNVTTEDLVSESPMPVLNIALDNVPKNS